MPFLELPHGDIYYTDHGEGDPIVLVHGRFASSACFDWHVGRLRELHRVITYDSINHGFSSNSPRGEAEPDRLDELHGLIDALGLERPVLVGQSMGAITVMRWAAHNPSRVRAVVAAGMGWPFPETFMDSEPVPLRDGLWIEAKKFDPEWARDHATEVARYSRLRSTATVIEFTRHPRSMDASFAEWRRADMENHLKSLNVPVHLFIGTNDLFAPGAENLASLLPHAQLTAITKADHSAYIQEAEAFIEIVQAAARS
jgi:pimeloyl-ACP methyl ester carboxylesterase